MKPEITRNSPRANKGMDSWSPVTNENSKKPTSKVLVISSSLDQQYALHAYLRGLGYGIAGPHQTVEEVRLIFKNLKPKLLIYDYQSNKAEFEHFKEFMKNEASNIPCIVIGEANQPVPNFENVTIYSPIDPVQLSYTLNQLIETEDKNHPSKQLVKFINSLLNRLIKLSLISLKTNIREIIVESFQSPRMATISRMYDAGKKVELTLIDETTTPQLISSYVKTTLGEIADRIDVEFEEVNWGESLVDEAIQYTIISHDQITNSINNFLTKLGINATEIRNSVGRVVPKLHADEKSLFVAYMSLSDVGPVMLNVVSNDDEISKGMDDGIASQIVTLVGAGSSYHEGIFGPIPIPTANNICGVIWSKILESDIRDRRQEGQSLSVIAIGFYNSLLTQIPKADKLKEIFSELDDLIHVNDVDKDTLTNIQNRFLQYI